MTKLCDGGVILKVTINIKDKANLNNSSKTKRVTNENLNLPNLFILNLSGVPDGKKS